MHLALKVGTYLVLFERAKGDGQELEKLWAQLLTPACEGEPGEPET